MTYSILYVCTGNICRSPMAERMLKHFTGNQVEVSSAGTDGVVGWSMTEAAADYLNSVNIDSSNHTARMLTKQMLADADLVLTATVAHLNHIRSLGAEFIQKTYTITEFDQQISSGEVKVADLQSVVREVKAETSGDIFDPYGYGADVYEKVGEELLAKSKALADWLIS